MPRNMSIDCLFWSKVLLWVIAQELRPPCRLPCARTCFRDFSTVSETFRIGNFVKIETKLKVTLMKNPVCVLYASENRVGFIIHRPGGCSRPAA